MSRQQQDYLQDVKQKLQGQALELARWLAPGGVVRKHRYMARNPARNDRTAGSFFITVSGVHAGSFIDYAVDESGDVLDLIQYVMGLPDTAAALEWAARWLGEEKLQRPQPQPQPESAQTGKKTDKKNQSDAEKAATVRKWFDDGMPIAGTLAETYLKRRGIDRPAAGWPDSLRFFPSLKHTFSGTSLPVMMAAWSDARGIVQAVHRTFLAPDGSGKAAVSPNRLTWPSNRGCVIRIQRGDGRADRPLILAEGIEDALSCAVCVPECPVWAYGSLVQLTGLRVPGGLHQIRIMPDNDQSNPVAEALLEKGIKHLRLQCPSVVVVRPLLGKDPNGFLLRTKKFTSQI